MHSKWSRGAAVKEGREGGTQGGKGEDKEVKRCILQSVARGSKRGNVDERRTPASKCAEHAKTMDTYREREDAEMAAVRG